MSAAILVLWAGLWMGLLLALVPGGSAKAAIGDCTVTVTNTLNSGVGSLRQNLIDVSAGGTICFDTAGVFSMPQTITLASGLSITKSLTISGTGVDNVVVSGASAYRVFSVTSGVNVTLHDLTVRDGYASSSTGAGIYSAGSLTLTAVNVLSSSVGTAAAGLGGGVYVTGALTLNGGQVWGNVAGKGGGLYVAGGTAALSGTAVYSNGASNFGGGIFANSGAVTVTSGSAVYRNTSSTDGGGIYMNGGTLTLTDTQVYTNTAANGAGGGIYDNGRPLSLYNSPVYSNSALGINVGGGGLYVTGGGVVRLKTHSDIYGNQVTNGSRGGGILLMAAETLEVTDSAIYSNTSVTTGGGICGASGATVTLDHASVYGNQATTQGGGIYFYLGTLTLTNTDIIANSAAQLGGGIWFNGATASASLYNVGIYSNTTAQSGGGAYFANGFITLTNVIIARNQANSSTGYGGGLWAINNSIVNMTGASSIYANSAASGGGLAAENSATLILSGTAIYSNSAVATSSTYGGGGLRIIGSTASVTLSGAQVYSNSSGYSGGGIYAVGGATVALTNTVIYTNSAGSSGAGGGLYISGTLTMTGGAIYDNLAKNTNSSTGNGGGLYVNGGSATLFNTPVLSNTSAAYGGGVSVNGGNATLFNTPVLSNTSAGYGGGVYVNGGALTISNTVLGRDLAGNRGTIGGGFFSNSTSGIVVTLRNVGVYSNTATSGGGGGLYVNQLFTGTNLVIASNVAGSDGGGVYVNGGATALAASAVYSNSGSQGGGIYFSAGQSTLTNVDFYSNTASNSGGGFCVFTAAAVTAITTTATGNNATVRGGGIYVSGAFTLTNGTVAGNNSTNAGGGIGSGSALLVTLKNSRVYSNNSNNSGGGIYHYPSNTNGVFAVDGSSIYSNTVTGAGSSYQGGGIYVYQGGLQITNTTVAYNRAAGDGGGLYAGSLAVLTVTNATIANNRSSTQGGGFFSAGGANKVFRNTIIANSTTISVSGGDISSTGVLTLAQVLTGTLTLGALQDNGGGTWTMALPLNSPAVDAGAGCPPPSTDQRGMPRPLALACDIGAFELLSTNLVVSKTVTPANVAYGGVVTYTLVLSNRNTVTDSSLLLTDTLPSSVVFGAWVVQPAGAVAGSSAITWSGPMTDSTPITIAFTANHVAGVITPITNTAYVSGTYQTLSASAAFTASCSTANGVQNTADAGPGSLRQALLDVCAGGLITFTPALDGQVITLTSGALQIAKSVTISSTGAGSLSISGNNQSRVITVGVGANVTLMGLTLRDGQCSGCAGGAIYNDGVLRLTGSRVLSSTAGDGGGLYNAPSAALVVDASDVYSNSGSTHGGGIYNKGVLTVTNRSSVYGNQAQYGGGISNMGKSGAPATLVIDAGNVASNTATSGGQGGGIHNIDVMTVTNGSRIFANTCSGCFGGGIYNEGPLSVAASTIDSNAADYGGGIDNYDPGILTAEQITVTGNSATSRGGGIYSYGVVTLTAGVISSNSCPGCRGGGIFNDAMPMAVANSAIYSNAAGTGGGIYNWGALTLTSSSLYTNTASDSSTVTGVADGDYGGGIYNKGAAASVTAANDTLFGNQAGSAGGGIYNESGTLAAVNVTLTANRAITAGGGIAAGGGTVALTNSIVANSVTAGSPGGDLAGVITATNGLTGALSLGALGNYGGATWTLPLLPGSPAIDAGSSAACAAAPVDGVDQRGVSRPQGSACDIGAFEVQGFTMTVQAGGAQTTTVASTFATPLRVQLSSAYSLPVGPGGVVTFLPPASGPGLSSAAAFTASVDASGVASVTVTANGLAGSYVVTASASGVPTPALFTLVNAPLSLTVHRAGTGSGRVDSDPAGIDCGVLTCTVALDYGAAMTLTATAEVSSTFTGWSGACTGMGACTVIVTETRAVTATFAVKTLALAVAKVGSGSGTVTSEPSGVACGVACTGAFAYGTSITLTAAAGAGSHFTGWSGGCAGADACALAITETQAVTAAFALNQYNITVSADPTVGGAVSGGGTYTHGDTVTVTAAANVGYIFAGWTDGVSTVSNAASYVFAATAGRALTATFSLSTYAITVNAAPTAGGVVSGGGVYTHGDAVTVTAAANVGYTFAGWTNGASTVSAADSFVFTATASRALTATFNPNTYTVTLNAAPTAGGIVSGSGPVNHGDAVTVTAAANAGYTFAGWTDGASTVSNAASYVFTVTASRALTATFSPDTYVMTVKASPAAGGVVTGDGGSYHYGDAVTVTAVANLGYTFGSWSDAAAVVALNPSYLFTATASRSLTASFSANIYTITLSVDPAAGGSVSGGGAAGFGDPVTVTAAANAGYLFVNWTEGATAVATDTVYSFVVDGDRSLVAHFVPAGVTAVNDAAGTVEGVPVTIDPLANDVNPAGGALTVIAVTQPANGRASIGSGGQQVIYTPTAGFVGLDSFQYTVQDSNGVTDDATIAVVVNRLPDSGNGEPQVAPVDPAQTTTVTFAANGGASSQIIVPAGAYTGTLGPKDIFYLVYTQVLTPTGNVNNLPPSLLPAGQVFRLNAYLNDSDLPNFRFAVPITVTLGYTPGSDIGNMEPATLELWYWDTDTNHWSQDGIQFVSRDLENHTVTYVIYHLTEFAYFGSGSQSSTSAYLPVVARSTLVYASSFTGGVTDHWTPPQLTTAPNGQRFLGEFGNQTATLALSGLEAHNRVVVSFDLYIIRSWDGNQTVVPPDFDPYRGLARGGAQPTIGPDQFRVKADGATLLDTTFSNWGQFQQNFPVPNSPAQSGAAAVNSLGYRFTLYNNLQDATYHITLAIAHSAPTLALEFLAAGLQALSDESWGVDNVVVTLQ